MLSNLSKIFPLRAIWPRVNHSLPVKMLAASVMMETPSRGRNPLEPPHMPSSVEIPGVRKLTPARLMTSITPVDEKVQVKNFLSQFYGNMEIHHLGNILTKLLNLKWDQKIDEHVTWQNTSIGKVIKIRTWKNSKQENPRWPSDSNYSRKNPRHSERLKNNVLIEMVSSVSLAIGKVLWFYVIHFIWSFSMFKIQIWYFLWKLQVAMKILAYDWCYVFLSSWNSSQIIQLSLIENNTASKNKIDKAKK